VQPVPSDISINIVASFFTLVPFHRNRF